MHGKRHLGERGGHLAGAAALPKAAAASAGRPRPGSRAARRHRPWPGSPRPPHRPGPGRPAGSQATAAPTAHSHPGGPGIPRREPGARHDLTPANQRRDRYSLTRTWPSAGKRRSTRHLPAEVRAAVGQGWRSPGDGLRGRSPRQCRTLFWLTPVTVTVTPRTMVSKGISRLSSSCSSDEARGLRLTHHLALRDGNRRNPTD